MYEHLNNYRIQQLDISYIDQVMIIENDSFITPWPREIIIQEAINNKSFCRVSLDENNIVNGYCISLLIYDELHILKIAVHKNYRRMGIANDLINDAFHFFKNKGVLNAILEVRTSNDSAIKLYKKLGFQILRTRRNYYRSSGEDAFVMMLDLENYYQKVLSTT
ncbi:MAG: ribosomal protein S18-alanine N-acetyltransferase [Candidatus Dadabacteria bacterium]|nr:ribosomal protein S18-alanine N-acetyltransferase [Candidatus Dadabacteria bacterium]NIQ14376.1 ribosomal protein S18-alanine N-acetyltransferase [Candidatus Dadabacteria bacterium]